jgi:hypothetical protein
MTKKMSWTLGSTRTRSWGQIEVQEIRRIIERGRSVDGSNSKTKRR